MIPSDCYYSEANAAPKCWAALRLVLNVLFVYLTGGLTAPRCPQTGCAAPSAAGCAAAPAEVERFPPRQGSFTSTSTSDSSRLAGSFSRAMTSHAAGVAPHTGPSVGIGRHLGRGPGLHHARRPTASSRPAAGFIQQAAYLPRVRLAPAKVVWGLVAAQNDAAPINIASRGRASTLSLASR